MALSYAAAGFAALLPYPLEIGHGLGNHAFAAAEGAQLCLLWVAFMLRVFQAHLGVLLLVLLAPAALLRLWRPVLAGLPVAIYALWPVLIDLGPKSPAAPAGETLRVLTSNLLARHAGFEHLLGEIAAADADIVALEEYDPVNAPAIAAALGESHPFSLTEPRQDNFGIALFSRFPLQNVRTDVRIGTMGAPQIRAEIEFGGRVLTLYVFHTFPAEGLDGLSELNLGFESLADELAAQQGPLLVCGDFNAPLNTQPMLHLLQATGLRSAQTLAGFGPATTWPNISIFRYLPGVRIDHILLSRELTATTCRVLPGHGSDHRPVVAEVGWAAAGR